MSSLPKSIRSLIESFEKLPGIGPKTAQRLSFYLLHVPQQQLDSFAEALTLLKKNTIMCSRCFNVSEADPCSICADSGRDEHLICVVEQAIDIIPFERTGKYKGLYHVLHGALNPLANIGPDEIRITELVKRLQNGISEIILATNFNTEGEVTAMYIKRQITTLRPDLKISRIAQGLPLGADVQYADEVTLREAMENRRTY